MLDIDHERTRRLRRCAREAKAMVGELLAKRLVVLKEEPGARAALEMRLFRCIKNGVFLDGWASQRLIDALVTCAAVDEVFMDFADADRALGRT